MEKKFTTGPWWSDSLDRVLGPVGEVICDVRSQDDYNKDIEGMANQKLIAAAPDLLEALIIISEMGNTGEDARDMKKAAYEAIKKALE